MDIVNQNQDTRCVNSQEMDRLSSWANRKPVIAVMGEFSSGKSTLLNMLVGETILPTQVTATRLPPVWFKYGDKAPFWMDKAGQKHAVDPHNLGSVPINEARFIRIYEKSEHLLQCDMIDTPGISDPNIPTDSWINTISYANSVLWCTHAGQAWRESERGQWESLPDRLRENSLLLVTRADKIVSRVDLDKINRRLHRETSNLFNAHHFISLTRAIDSLEGKGDADLWLRSGAEAFMASFDNILAEIKKRRIQVLSRYQSVSEKPINLQVQLQFDDSQKPLIETAKSNVEEKHTETVSILRPKRTKVTTSNQKRVRMNKDDAAKMRNDALLKM